MIKQLDWSVALYFASITLLILITHLPGWVIRGRDKGRDRIRPKIRILPPDQERKR